MLIKISDNFYVDWEKILFMGAINGEYCISIEGSKQIIITYTEYSLLRSQIDKQVLFKRKEE